MDPLKDLKEKQVSGRKYLIILSEFTILLLMISFERGEITFYVKNVDTQKFFLLKTVIILLI